MSEADEIEDITNAAGTGTVDFPNGLNIAGSNSGIVGVKHTVSGTAPSIPSNGDTWYDDNASIYYVRINNEWKAWLGSPPVYASTFTKGQVIDTEDLENASGFTSFHSQSQFNSNGTKWFVATLDTNQYDVLFEEWDLGTAYDLSTATYNQSIYKNINVEQGGVRAMTFNGDGTKLLIWCRTPAGSSPRARAYTFTLSTAYDISTLSSVPSYFQTTGANGFDGSAGGNGKSYTWTPDGSVLYASEHTSRVCKVEVGTNYDITSITTSEQLESDDMGITPTGTYISVPSYGVGFRNNGKLCYILQGTSDSILHETLLSTPYDITTGTLLSSVNLGDPPYSIENSQNILMTPTDVIVYGTLGLSNGGYKYTYVNVTSNSSSVFTWGGDRGVFVGGAGDNGVYQNTIDYIDISTTGNASDFGDLRGSASYINQGASNGTRGVFFGGFLGFSNGGYADYMDYITFATTGNAQDFGDMSASIIGTTGASDGTYGVMFGGREYDGVTTTFMNVIEYITIATTGNTTDFGDMTITEDLRVASSGDTRLLVAGGRSDNITGIEYVTAATPGNATTFGNLNRPMTAGGSASDSIRALFAIGYSKVSSQNFSRVNDIEYVNVAITANANDFGDLTNARTYMSGVSNGTRGAFGGGILDGNNHQNVVDYIVIQTTGNATDLGDLTVARGLLGGASGNAA